MIEFQTQKQTVDQLKRWKKEYEYAQTAWSENYWEMLITLAELELFIMDNQKHDNYIISSGFIANLVSERF